MAHQKKKGDSPASKSGDELRTPSTADMPDLAESALNMFAAERDLLLTGDLPDSALPQSEEEYVSRDPFSADYVEFRLSETRHRNEKQAKVNTKVRADLLEQPHLLEKPAESGSRGAAAIWRSLRDMLREESHTVMDNSGLQELLMLKRELETRKRIVEAVNEGLANQLKRLEQRLSVYDKEATQIVPAKVEIKKD